MYCMKCGAEIIPNTNFCVKCGTQVITDSICTKCGKKLESEMQFCPYCGTDKKKNNSSSQMIVNLDLSKSLMKKDSLKEFIQKNKMLITRGYVFVLSLIIILLCFQPVVMIPRYDMSYIYGGSTFGEIAKLAKIYEEWETYVGAMIGYGIIGVEILQVILLFKTKKIETAFAAIRLAEALGLVFFGLIVYAEMQGMSFCSSFWVICSLIIISMVFGPNEFYKYLEKLFGNKKVNETTEDVK